VNLATMTGLCDQAAGHGADLVAFCEAALTGFAGNDDPRHDLGPGEPVPGPATIALGQAARRLGLWIEFGLFERASPRSLSRRHSGCICPLGGHCGPADTLKLACAPACRLRW